MLQNPKHTENIYAPLKAMPEEATTQVWITVFSCLVKGCLRRPHFWSILVHVLTKKNPNKPAETLREGIIPVVKLSFITMKLNIMLNKKLTPKALIVSWFFHTGTSWLSKIFSTDFSPPPFTSFLPFFSHSPPSELIPLSTLSPSISSISGSKTNLYPLFLYRQKCRRLLSLYHVESMKLIIQIGDLGWFWTQSSNMVAPTAKSGNWDFGS